MQTKEKPFKLIFFKLICFVFIWLFLITPKTLAATITGNVEDENGSPIANVNVQGSLTDDSGLYEIDTPDDNIVYEFQEEVEEAKASSVTYVPETNKKYNIVIVKPENDCENEYKEINNIFTNCSEKNEKIITYNASGFSDGITDPYAEYKKICGENYLDNDYINLFIVIGNSDMPVIYTTSEQGKLANGNIFYDIDANKLPQHMQRGTTIGQIISQITQYGKIEEKKEELDTTINSKNVTINLEENKNQTIQLVVKIKKEIDIVGFITGTIYLEDGSRDKITEHEYGNSLNKITVELISIDTGDIKVTEVIEGKYGFEKPEEGRYKLKFKYNGQEFRAIEKESDDVIDATSDRNHIQYEIDREEFNERNNRINNEKAKRILNWDESLINIYAETIEFEVKDDIEEIGEPGDDDYQEGYIDPPKYLNLVLEKRPEFEIEFKKEINVVKVTLADGQIYQENRMEEISSQVQMRQIIMDEELMHGATIEIEYLITATIPETAEGEIKIEEIKVIDYLDYERNKLEYKKDLKLTDETNEEAGWQLVNKENLKSEELKNCIEQKLLDNDKESGGLKERDYLIGTLKRLDDKTYQTKLVVSKLISSSLDDEDLIWSNSLEIIEYSNSEGRRMVWEEQSNLEEIDKNIPGNFNPIYLTNDLDYMNGVKDTAIAEDVFIIPPFGGANNVFINLNKYIKQKNNFLNKEDVEK